jgi:hypothetical protein
MKRLYIGGACLVALFALSALGAVSALANPEFIMKTGATLPTKFDIVSGTGTFSTVTGLGHSVITCEHGQSKGEIVGSTNSMLASKIEASFFGKCGSTGFISGACKEPILTKTLMGTLGYIKKEAAGPVGLLLFPETSGSKLVAEFECGGTKVPVEGEVIGEFPTQDKNATNQYNVFREKFELVFKTTAANNGIQAVQTFLLLASVLSEGFMEKVHLTSTALKVESGREATEEIRLLPEGETGEIKA